MNIKLISAKGSNSSERVEWVLNFKNIVFEREECAEDPGEDYLKINPMFRVPAMLVDGTPLSESIAMIEYLEEIQPTPPAFPGSAIEKAKIREICEIINATVHPVQNSKVARFFIPQLTNNQVRDFRKKWIFENLLKLSPLLFQQSKFAYGRDFSAADIFVAAMYRKGLELGIGLDELPTLTSHLRFLFGIEHIKSSCPFEIPPVLE